MPKEKWESEVLPKIADADLRMFANLRRCATELVGKWGIEQKGALGSRAWTWGVVGVASGWVIAPSPAAIHQKQELIATLRLLDSGMPVDQAAYEETSSIPSRSTE